MRPVGSVTRGTTHPNRLRRVDRWIVHSARGLLRGTSSPLVVDLGFGASPITTVELADRLARETGKHCRVVGLEIDQDRVRDAQPWARPGLEFRRGGFEIPGERPLVIRAFNVLRQYPESDVAGAWAAMVHRLAPGGVLVEGTCDELGRRAAWIAAYADDADDGPVIPRTLTLSAHLATLERPSDLAERLPKALIHRNVAGERIHGVLGALDRAWAVASPSAVFGARQRWIAAMQQARDAGVPIRDGPVRWRLGEVTVDWAAVAPART